MVHVGQHVRERGPDCGALVHLHGVEYGHCVSVRVVEIEVVFVVVGNAASRDTAGVPPVDISTCRELERLINISIRTRHLLTACDNIFSTLMLHINK